MNLDYARKKIMLEVNKQHTFLYRGSRNQKEVFSGKITKVYSSVFIIECNDKICCYSLNDYIIGCIKIIS